VRCDKCGHEEVALKTCRRRNGEATGVLCNSCWEPVRHLVWIVPGPVACFGRCSGCSRWFDVRELVDRKPGGGHGAWIGTCEGCLQQAS
jgi:hypothetical protein